MNNDERLAMARRAFKRLQREFEKNAAEIEAVLSDSDAEREPRIGGYGPVGRPEVDGPSSEQPK